MRKISQTTACLSALVACSALLGGCASMGSTETTADMQKVQAIERAAQHNGVKVYWLSYPTKKVTATSTSTGS